jgi:hypothetical protein
MATIVVAPTTASTAKTLATTPRMLGLGFGLVDGQGPASQIGSIQGRYRFVGFTGIGHLDEPETTGSSRIPIGDQCDLFDRAMCLEKVAQFGFRRAVRQISNVKVFHCNSSLSKSSRLVGVADRPDGRPSESRGGAGRERIAWVRATEAERTAEIRREASRMPQR